jgi:hypothetical protein
MNITNLKLAYHFILPTSMRFNKKKPDKPPETLNRDITEQGTFGKLY